MVGFVGSRARKRRRSIFLTIAFLVLFVAIYFIFPTFQLNIDDPIPDENLIPDPTEDLTSLASNIEDLELTVFQKDQKIKFRDGQIKNLQTELQDSKLKYDSAILELTEIKNDLNTISLNKENLIQPDKFKSLQDKFNKLNIENDKLISIIQNLNNEIDDLNNNIQLTDINRDDLINENQKLKKDNKSIFAQNIKLENSITLLKEEISEKQIEIETYLEEIKKLKDKSHHGS